MNAIVCEDPSNSLAIGTVIRGQGNIVAAIGKGVATLPFNDQLPAQAMVGYVQRHFGLGWLFDSNAGERGCPLALQVSTLCRFLYWSVRVGPARPGPWGGQFRLVHSAENQRGIARGMTQLTHPQFESAEGSGDVVLTGKNAFSTTTEGLLYCDLYVRAFNTRVKWLAITEHELELES